MKNIVKIFKRDLKSIVKNPIALIIVAGVCVIPALYAWVNIKACWDRHKGNLSQVATALGISRAALYRRLEKFGISV